MKCCLLCFRAAENVDAGHCGDCPCCSVCIDHGYAGCPVCNDDEGDGISDGNRPLLKPPLGDLDS